MTTATSRDAWRASLAQRRDQALRDLLELEQQVQAGEVPPASAEALRRRYERSAAEALALLAGEGPPVQAAEQPVRRRRPSWRTWVYAAGALTAVVALAVALPPALNERPSGGFVTGNEALSPAASPTAPPSAPAAAPPGRDLSKVSDAEMEAVVAANPDVLGMRLALAQRYLDQGAFDKALPHYRQVLQREPDNAVALASLGWVQLQIGDAAAAATFAAQATERDPALPLAWWVQANVRLYGQDDPTGAVEALRRMQQLPLEPDVQQQVATLLAQAQTRATADRGRP